MKRHFKIALLCLLTAPGLVWVGCRVFANGAEGPAPKFFLESETERLVKEIIHKGYTTYTSALKRRPSKTGTVAALAMTELPKLTVESSVEKEFAWIQKFKEKEEPSRVATPMRFYPKGKLSEGDLLYRVAVADKKVTLKEAEEIGIANNYLMRSMKKKIDVAKAKVVEARRGLFPTVQGVVEYNGGKAQGTSTNLGGRLYKGMDQKLNMTMPVFDGGEIMMTIKQAEANLRSAQEDFDKARNETIQQVRTAYYGVVKTEYNLQYQLVSYREAEAVYRQVKAGYKQNVVSEVDALSVESQYYTIYFQAESARNDLLSAYLVLYQTLSIELEEAIFLDLRLSFSKIDPDLYEVMDRVMRNNPEVRMKQEALDSAEWGVRIYKAKNLPKVSLRGSFGYLGEVFKDTQAITADNADLDTEKEWFLGVNVSMPLGANTIAYDQIKHKYGPTILALTGSEDWKQRVTFDLFDRFPDLTDAQSAEATYWQALAELDKAKDDAIVKTKDEVYNLRKSLVQIDSAIAKMRYQERQNDILRYLMGIQESSPGSYLEGLNEQAQNKFSFIQAVVDYHLAVSNLNLIMGEPNHFEIKPQRALQTDKAKVPA